MSLLCSYIIFRTILPSSKVSQLLAFLSVPHPREVPNRMRVRICRLFRKWEDRVLRPVNDRVPFIVTVNIGFIL